MKTEFKNMYVIVRGDKEILPRTVRYVRKHCITEFVEGFDPLFTYERFRTDFMPYGWKCIKVTVNFKL